MKRLLLAPLLITLSFLNMGFIGKPKLEAIYCDQEKYLKASNDEMWKNYPWIFDNKTGKLYDYDDFLNEISPLNEWRFDDEIYTYKSRLENNKLKIVESEKNLKYADRRYLIDLKAKKITSFNVDTPEDKLVGPCKKLDLPKGVKINY